MKRLGYKYHLVSIMMIISLICIGFSSWNITNQIGGQIAWGTLDFFWSFVYLVGMIISMLALNWRLALLVIAVMPFVGLTTMYFQKRILRGNRMVRKTNSLITGAFNEGITGARTTKTLVIEDDNHSAFRSLLMRMKQQSMHVERLRAVYIPALLALAAVATALVIARGGTLAVQGEIGGIYYSSATPQKRGLRARLLH